VLPGVPTSEGEGCLMEPSVPSEIVEQIGRSFNRALDDATPWLQQVGEDEFFSLVVILEMIERLPEHLIILSGLNLFVYRRSLASIRLVTSSYHKESSLLTIFPIGDLSPLYILLHALSECPDSMPPGGTSDLPFFRDMDLRNAIRLDMSEVEQALSYRQWKAATILGGAVLDSIIYWALSGLQKSFSGKPLNERMLGDLIQLAHTEKLLSDHGRNLAKEAKDARNLIHAGVGDRERRECDKASSHAVIAAIETAVKDVSNYCANNGNCKL
jgi:hypothetical protein